VLYYDQREGIVSRAWWWRLNREGLSPQSSSFNLGWARGNRTCHSDATIRGAKCTKERLKLEPSALVAQNKELPRRCVSRETSRELWLWRHCYLYCLCRRVNVTLLTTGGAHTALGLMSPVLLFRCTPRPCALNPTTAPTHPPTHTLSSFPLCAKTFTFAILILARAFFMCSEKFMELAPLERKDTHPFAF